MNRASKRLLSLSSHLVRPAPLLSPALLPRNRRSMSSPASPPESSTQPSREFDFEISKIPKNPLGEGRCIRTAAALIIGDEILNGKTLDRNSNYFARFCFEHGIELKRVEVIADDEAEIIEASRRMVQNYDFVVTSGGIGPTHDDITYASLAASFSRPLVHHPETLRRMNEMTKHRSWTATQTPEQRAARERMALFPAGDPNKPEGEGGVEVLFVKGDIWVPVIRLEGKLCIFPGIPALFQKMLDNLAPFLPLPPPEDRPLRLQVFTPLPESSIAPYLTTLQKRVQPEGIRIGSYPVIQKGVYVSLIGSDNARVKEIGKEVEKETEGREVTEQEMLERRRRQQSGSFGG